MTGRLAELLARSCEALEAAENELDMIAETPIPASDALTEALRRQEIGEAVLRRILRAAPPERRRRLGAMCREERARLFGDHAEALLGNGYPVMPEVLAELADTREELRRAALVDPEVRAALDDVLVRGWAW